jgi:hypothetical protein
MYNVGIECCKHVSNFEALNTVEPFICIEPRTVQWNLELQTQSVPGEGLTFELNFPI